MLDPAGKIKRFGRRVAQDGRPAAPAYMSADLGRRKENMRALRLRSGRRVSTLRARLGGDKGGRAADGEGDLAGHLIDFCAGVPERDQDIAEPLAAAVGEKAAVQLQPKLAGIAHPPAS